MAEESVKNPSAARVMTENDEESRLVRLGSTDGDSDVNARDEALATSSAVAPERAAAQKSKCESGSGVHHGGKCAPVPIYESPRVTGVNPAIG